MKLATNTGSVELAAPTGDRCATCTGPAATENAVRVIVDAGPVALDVPAICGGCLMEGLAILFGRRHVQQGGNVTDLQLAPDPPDSVA